MTCTHPSWRDTACAMLRNRTKSSVRIAVRFTTICIILACVVAYHHFLHNKEKIPLKENNGKSRKSTSLALSVVEYQNRYTSRRLLDSGDDEDNCTKPREPHAGYNDSCDYVLDQCSGSKEVSLINYLSFVLCDLRGVQVSLDVHYSQHFAVVVT